MHGTIENLSSSGALVSVAGVPFDEDIDVELKLGDDSGWVSARTVRIERTARTAKLQRLSQDKCRWRYYQLITPRREQEVEIER